MTSGTQIAPTPVLPVVPRISGRRRLHKLGWNVLGLIVLVVMVFPVYWMVATAFKPGQKIFSYTPQWIPTSPTLSNFRDAINQPFFWDAVKNSVIVVTVVVALSVALAFLAALALAKFRFYGRKAFIVLILGVQMVPLAALIIPLYILMSRLHQVDKLTGVIAMYLTFVLPFTVWTMRGFLLGIPEGARGGGDGGRRDPLRRIRARSSCRSSAPVSSRRRSSPSSRPGTSSSLPTCSCTHRRSRR